MEKMLTQCLLLCHFVGMFGACAPDRTERLRTEKHLITVPTEEQYSFCERVSQSIELEAPRAEIIDLITSGLEMNHPYVTVTIMVRVALWASDNAGRGRELQPFIDSCLASNHPFTRLAGIGAAQIMGWDELVRSELERDSHFLLARPSPSSLWELPICLDSQGIFQRLDVAGRVWDTRISVIEFLGDHEIHHSLPILEAILRDRNEHRITREAAQKAAAQLRSL